MKVPLTLFDAAQHYIHFEVQDERTIKPELVLQLLTMCREACDAHLSKAQQSQLDMMIATVIGDIVMDNK